MVQPAITALALVFILNQQAIPYSLQTLQVGIEPVREEVEQSPTLQPDGPFADPDSNLEQEPPLAASDVITRTDPVLSVEPSKTGTVQTTAQPTLETGHQSDAQLPIDQDIGASNTGIAPSFPVTSEVTRHSLDSPGYAIFLERGRISLTSAKTASGRFIQENTDGSLYSGTFALSRPGRLRFEYDAPVPVLIVADGTTVAMEDRDLETIDRVPLSATPLGIILNDDLQFTDDILVQSIIERESDFDISVEDASGEMLGSLTMTFDKSENTLIGWRAIDGELNATRVRLQDVEINQRINPRQFILRDAEDEEDER